MSDNGFSSSTQIGPGSELKAKNKKKKKTKTKKTLLTENQNRGNVLII